MENYQTYKALVKTLEGDYRRAANENNQDTCYKLANELAWLYQLGMDNGWEV